MRRYAPALPETTPEIYTGCSGMYPTADGGYAVFPSAGAAIQTCQNRSAILTNVAGTGYLFHGSSTKLYQSTTDVSRLAGGNYTSGNWRFAAFGNLCVAVNGKSADAPQSITMGGANFAALGGSPPKADCIVIQSLAVVLLSYNDGVNTYEDGWWASDIGDATTWTPADSNDAANGRLLQTPGAIKGAAALNGDVIVFKDFSVYRLTYVGAPIKWSSQLIATGIGCSSQEAILSTGDALYFVGRMGAFRFDGNNFARIDADVWDGQNGMRKVSNGFSTSSLPFGIYNEAHGLCVWYWAVGSETHTRTWVYNVKTGAWGYNTFGVGVASYRISSAPYPQDFRSAAAASVINPVILQTSCWLVRMDDSNLYLLDTAYSSAATKNASPELITERIGSDVAMTEVSGVIPHFAQDVVHGTEATSATFTLVPKTATSSIATVSNGSSISSSGDLKRFDYMKSARYHQFQISNNTHGWKLMSLTVKTRPAGSN